MPKVENNYKLSVDFYNEVENGIIECHCYTPGLTGEDSYMTKTVSWEQLKEFVCDKFGDVRCTFFNDTQESECVPFERWYSDNRHSSELHDALADFINKNEGRKMLAPLANLDNAITSAMQKLDKVMHILKPAKTA